MYTVLGFLDERDDASVARVCKDYAALRRAFVLRCGCDCKQLWNVCYSSDGRYVATDAGRDISVYDAATGQLCYRHTNYDMGAGREVRALAFSDEPGLTFAAGGIDHVGEVVAPSVLWPSRSRIDGVAPSTPSSRRSDM